MFSLGTLSRRPSALRPDLIAMQSSPVSNVQRSISTSRHDSGSQPSLFGPWLSIVTPRTVTFVQSTGLISHIGELTIVTPSMSTLRAAVRLDEVRPQVAALAEHALGDRHAALGHVQQALPRRVAVRRAVRPAESALPFHGHQCSSSAWPSSVPSPVMAMFSLLERVDERRVVHQLRALEARQHRGQVAAPGLVRTRASLPSTRAG